MKHALKAYLSKSQTIIALVVALMALTIFVVCWMTAYDGVNNRTDQLKIAVVNEDGEFGSQLIEQLKGNLPFEITTPSAEDARTELERRKVHLIMTIPSEFGSSLTSPNSKATIHFTVNQSNPQMTRSVMDSVVARITQQMKDNTILQGTQAVLEQLNMPEEQAGQTAQALLSKVEAETETINPIQGMQNQMLPMMLVLGCFVGSMLMAMNLQQVTMAIGSALSARQHFGVRVILNIAAAFIISIVGSTLIYALGGQMESGFLLFWLFTMLTLITFMFFSQLFLLLLGMAGMFVNMMMLSLQLVTSGTIVPREVLSGFFKSLGHFLPATYAVDGLFNLGFGGIQTGHDVGILFLIVAISSGLGFVLLQVRVKKQPASVGSQQPASNEVVAN
ncbi:YhgE/Pip-like protein [Paenibacillus cellulosilyticus]|uniref:YhgE/Pip-like protein n=1 Tax=Paenibacillus cellulosilyticus TaxID=375489 RepID=A0A2V2YXD5_9BACL|nr:ABC transporter permease [Paenibacillus cellulosilyticus]PWW04848.1 YhgE/Pip-like protein [Paenibacillus cellulosilyticus]QKS45960.1 ABC transporter permease [Paenibacillus cellulosilyticus]